MFRIISKGCDRVNQGLKTEATELNEPAERRSRIFVIRICPAGLLLALIAHVILTISAVRLTSHNDVYWLSALAYGTLSAIIATKLFKDRLQRHSRQSRSFKRRREHEAWEHEFE